MYRDEQRERRRRRLIETFSPEKILTKTYRSRTRFLGIAVRGLDCSLGPVLIFLLKPGIRRTSSFFNTAGLKGPNWVINRWKKNIQVIEVPNNSGRSRSELLHQVLQYLCWHIFEMHKDSYDAVVFADEISIANHIIYDRPVFMNSVLRVPLYEGEILNMFADAVYANRMQEVLDYYRTKHNFYISKVTPQLYDMLYKAFGASKHIKLFYLAKAAHRDNMREFKHVVKLAIYQVIDKYKDKLSVDGVMVNKISDVYASIQKAVDILKKNGIIKLYGKVYRISVSENKWLLFVSVMINPIYRRKFIPIMVERRARAYQGRHISNEAATRVVSGCNQSCNP